MPLRFWAFMLLAASILGGILNLTVLRDAEVTAGVLLGASIAVITLVAARPRKGKQ